ncbi:MAG: hypothetical protein IJ852_02300 [Alphaproteobacteria bacterium]|nr:hypothetical protein [Alphaproteobacteria bacterium]
MADYDHSVQSQIRDKLVRKAQTMENRPRQRWRTNFGMIASLSGVIITPIVLGIFGGGYLDEVWPQHFSWRLTGLFLGFIWGIGNAYFWIKIENEKIEKIGSDRRL